MARPRTAPRRVDNPGPEQWSLQGVLDALADPVRRALVVQLADAGDDMACGTFDVRVSASTLTHHFTVLREAGLVRQYYVGTAKMNALRGNEMEARFPGLLSALLAAAHRERDATLSAAR
ncbi:ArsR/SmtB family transcription factor [Streptomyces sp. MS19]|uniref:ArsR/SmtB family transcription factor n=1 Tax=Streptomyces sp. MS19 TaxID=3385972 RepID=UPI0039A11FEF